MTARQPRPPSASQLTKTVLLVHGAWHGAWCYAKLAAALSGAGWRAHAFDLPGHGGHARDPATVTFDDYVDAVVGVLEAQSEPVILVGHSMGGMVISEAAERAPEKIAKLVYLCAFLPGDGDTLLKLKDRGPSPELASGLRPSADGKTATVDREVARAVFYHDCAAEDAEEALDRLTPQPLEAYGHPVSLTPERFGRVRRAYVACTEDRVVPIALQREMAAAALTEASVEIACGHSPFLARPAELAAAVSALAAL